MSTIEVKNQIKLLAAEQTELRKQNPRGKERIKEQVAWQAARSLLRLKLRSLMLIYAFMRGVPYSRLERNPREVPPCYFASCMTDKDDALPVYITTEELKTWIAATS